MKTLNNNIKLTADFLPKIEIRWLKKHGYLDNPKSGGIEWGDNSFGRKDIVRIESHPEAYHPFIRLSYSQTDSEGSKQDFDYKIDLNRTPCHYGGYRYWFLCPLSKGEMVCGRRSGVLYKAGDYFGCRYCHNLTYLSRKHNTSYSLNSCFRSRKTLNKIMALEAEIKESKYAGKSARKKLDKLLDLDIPDLSNF